MADWAVVFDVDGVLLELTRAEEDIFFTALSRFVATENLSRDWNSYSIRNDEDIIAEILANNHVPAAMITEVIRHYLALLSSSTVQAVPVAGAAELLFWLRHKTDLGIATANLLGAAQHRLQQAGLWQSVSTHAQGAEGGGHKSVILGRAIANLDKPQHRIIYIGDNLNDVQAGLVHGVHFIGFSESPERRQVLRNAGAAMVSADHAQTLTLIQQLLA